MPSSVSTALLLSAIALAIASVPTGAVIAFCLSAVFIECFLFYLAGSS